jgi:peptidoglycan/xylan/chitin deacetylase (PgdA/CDA1 family)
MFFDFSRHRMLPLLVLTVIMAGGIAIYMIFNTQYQPEQRVKMFFDYSKSSVVYWFKYKFPQDYASFAAAVGLSRDSSPIVESALAESSGIAESIPVLLYHGEGPGNVMSIETFVEQLHALKANGWRTITLTQFTDFMKHGARLPDKSFLLTFDDGRKDTFYPADPVLKDLGYTAVMFVITGFSMPENGPISSFYLSPFELRQMIKSGRWELQSHGDQDHRVYTVPTATSSAASVDFFDEEHFLSNLFWIRGEERVETADEYSTRVTNDLKVSKEKLETQLNIPITSFAYPFNDFGENTVNFPASTEILDRIVPSFYTFAFYQIWSTGGDTFNFPDPDEYFIKRIEPLAVWSGKELLLALEKGRAKALPYTATIFGEEWGGTWGNISSSRTLTLAAHATTTGATAFLNGSGWWKDYDMTATVDWKRGQNVALIARHSNTQPAYLICVLGKDRLLLQQRLSSGQTTIASAQYSFTGQKSSTTYSMSVQGNEATCSAYGTTVRGTFAAEIPKEGGIAIEVWDPDRNNAEMTVKSIEVKPLSPSP